MPDLTFPIRAAFYYPWFPQAWEQGGVRPFTRYTPDLRWYDSHSEATVRAHIQAMAYGRIQAGIASWWGQGHYTDHAIDNLLRAAEGTGFRWCLYYEEESTGDPSVEQIRADLAYIKQRYAANPAYLTVDGKFVVFVYAGDNDAAAMATRWHRANTVGAYIVLKVFPGYEAIADQPDSWHQYSPAVAADQQGKHSYAISPGFWLMGQPLRLARNLTRWKQNVREMVASGAQWQLVTTFNEWGEGTSVEGAKEWARASGWGAYLDALRSGGR